MDNAFADKCKEAVADLKKIPFGFLLWDNLTRFDNGGKISIAELLHNIVVLAALHHIEEPDNVIRFNRLHDLDLREQRIF